ncbi:hypothetical protein MRB53_028808 [Persea americana]|uniref:Uncharacterized protein n=1 Tax=Persea americana TaxID=3435 RepID=A0ACC2KH47_PERAE|nr:hypothetical protein MRB53_028808 [Persea americana]
MATRGGPSPPSLRPFTNCKSSPTPCDTRIFELDYNRFLQDHYGRKPKKWATVVFHGKELDHCCLFNAAMIRSSRRRSLMSFASYARR